MGCWVSWKCFVACRLGLESQQPTWPQERQSRRWTQRPPIFRHSSQPLVVCGWTGFSSWTCVHSAMVGGEPARPRQRGQSGSTGFVVGLLHDHLVLHQHRCDALSDVRDDEALGMPVRVGRRAGAAREGSLRRTGSRGRRRGLCLLARCPGLARHEAVAVLHRRMGDRTAVQPEVDAIVANVLHVVVGEPVLPGEEEALLDEEAGVVDRHHLPELPAVSCEDGHSFRNSLPRVHRRLPGVSPHLGGGQGWPRRQPMQPSRAWHAWTPSGARSLRSVALPGIPEDSHDLRFLQDPRQLAGRR